MDRAIVLAAIVQLLIYWSNGEKSSCKIAAKFARCKQSETLDTVIDCGQEIVPNTIDFDKYRICDQLWWNGSNATSSLYRLALDAVIDPSRESQMKDMTISGFYADVLRANTFYNFHELRMLHLEQNHFSAIADDAFNKLSNLRTLHLRNNGMNHIKWNTFNQARSLETIIIEETKVKRLSVNFEDLINLKVLRITNVKMISHQTIELLFSTKTGRTRALKSVDIADTDIEKNFTLGLDYQGENLKHLGIVNCNLKAIRAYLPYLEHLNLSRNCFRSEIYLELYNMHSLRILDLRGNLLRSLRGRFCESCHKLEKVYLNDNRIHFVAFDALSKHRRLDIVDFTNNSLVMMQPGVQMFLKYVSSVISDENPWDCRWLEETLRDPDEVFEKLTFKQVSNQINVKGLGCVVYPDPTTATITTDISTTLVPASTIQPPENLVDQSWMILMPLTVTLMVLSCMILALIVWNNWECVVSLINVKPS